MKKTNVILVHLGERLPSYAKASIRLMAKSSGLRPLLVCSSSSARGVSKSLADLAILEDFYDSSEFESVSSTLTSSLDFRDGLWRYSLERFFVLRQLVDTTNTDSFVHAELDQLLFRVDEMVDSISQSGKKGIFLPFHSPGAAVASVVYCNQTSALDSFLEYCHRAKEITNEMAALAHWSSTTRKHLVALPTLVEFSNKSSPVPNGVPLLPAERLSGVVDAAQLGQWVGGIDPRNVPLPAKPLTRHADPDGPDRLARSDLETLRLSLDSDTGHLLGMYRGGKPMRIFNLHLHSKIHPYIEKKPARLAALIEPPDSSLPKTIPAARAMQIESQWRRLLGTFVRRSIKKMKRSFHETNLSQK